MMGRPDPIDGEVGGAELLDECFDTLAIGLRANASLPTFTQSLPTLID